MTIGVRLGEVNVQSERWTSQNGRWGLELIADNELPVIPRSGTMPGSIESMGTYMGQQMFRILPQNPEKPTWVYVGGDVTPIEGASVVTRIDLQGGRDVSVLLLGPVALLKEWGYKRRDVTFRQVVEGSPGHVSPGVLVALGIFEAKGQVDIKEPPPPSTAFADALRKAMAVSDMPPSQVFVKAIDTAPK